MFCASFRANFIAQQEKEAANRGFFEENVAAFIGFVSPRQAHIR